MKAEPSIPRLTRAQQETESEAIRLIEQIKNAIAGVTGRSAEEAGSLDTTADRIERASRDLAFALRELARERRVSQDETA